MKFCPKCNEEYDDGFMFCHHCGEKLQKKIEVAKEITLQNNVEQKFCPYCGEEIDADSNFCPFCSKSLSKNEIDDNIDDNIEKSIKDTETKYSDNTSSKWETFIAVIKAILYLFGWFIIILLSKGCGRWFAHAYRFESFVIGIIVLVLFIGYYVYSWISNRKK